MGVFRTIIRSTMALLLLSATASTAQAAKALPYQARNDLERLHIAARAGQADMTDFIKAMLKAPLCAALLEDKAGHSDLNPLDGIALVHLAVNGGDMSLALFTDKSRVKEITGKEPFCGPGLIFFQKAEGAIYINPGYEVGIPVNADGVKATLAFAEKQPKPAGAGMVMRGPGGVLSLKAPANPPAGMVPKLKAALAAEPLVLGAELAEGTWSESKETTWVVSLLLAEGQVGAVDTRLTAAIKGVDRQGRPVEYLMSRKPDTLAWDGIVLK
jgi:hypothetical protein